MDGEKGIAVVCVDVGVGVVSGAAVVLGEPRVRTLAVGPLLRTPWRRTEARVRECWLITGSVSDQGSVVSVRLAQRG